MSELLMDCQINITRLIHQVESALQNHHTKVKSSVQDSFKTIKKNLKSPERKRSEVKSVLPGCERRDQEVKLAIGKDKRGLLFLASGSPESKNLPGYYNNNNNNSKRYVVSPIPSPKKLRLSEEKVRVKGNVNQRISSQKQYTVFEDNKVNVITRQPKRSDISKLFDSLFDSKKVKTKQDSPLNTDNQPDKENKTETKLECNQQNSDSKSETDSTEMEAEAIIGEIEMARLDYTSMSQQHTLDIDPIKCDIQIGGKECRLSSSGDSGYDINSDLGDENICGSPRSSTDTDNTVWMNTNKQEDSTIQKLREDNKNHTSFLQNVDDNRTKTMLDQTPHVRHIGSPEMSSSVERAIETDNGTYSYSNRRSQRDIEAWITAQSPYVGKTPLHLSAFRSSILPRLPHHTPMDAIQAQQLSFEGSNCCDPVCRTLNVYEFDNDSYSTASSLPPKCDLNHNVTDLDISVECVEDAALVADDTTDLHQELAQALVDEVENLSTISVIEKRKDSNDNLSYTILETSFNGEATTHQSNKLPSGKGELLVKIDARKDELHKMVDQWHQWISNKIELAYNQEHMRLEREEARIAPVAGVCSPAKSMCTFLNTKHKLNRDMFGTFTTLTAHHASQNHASRNEPPKSYYMCHQSTHLRTFETRDGDTTTEYMATAINADPNGNYTVTDMGADTCRIFTPDGQLLKDLDTAPLDEPTYALTDNDNYTLLACRSGLKLYNLDGTYNRDLARGDIKLPQCISTDSVGNYIVSDTHDAGSVIVTLERDSLLPVRMFCGTQYENSPEAFTSAWYVHVTRDNNIVLSDRDDHMIKCYTPHGEYLWGAGGYGADPGQFFTPAGIAEDRLGNILVADCNNDRVQVFSGSGEWLGVVLSGEVSNVDLKCPTDVAIDCNDNLVVLQASGTVSVFSYMTSV